MQSRQALIKLNFFKLKIKILFMTKLFSLAFFIAQQSKSRYKFLQLAENKGLDEKLQNSHLIILWQVICIALNIV